MKEKPIDPITELTAEISIPRSLPCKFFYDIFKRAQELNSVLYASTLPSAISDNERSLHLYRRLANPRASNSQYQLRHLCSLSPPKNIPFQRIIKDNLVKKFRTEERKLSTEVINRIIFNDKGHIVSIFKDYSILDELKEYIEKFVGVKFSLTKLKELTKKYKYLAPFRFHWKEYKALERAESIKSRMKQFRNRIDKKENKDVSTLLISSFRNSLAREDLASSWSILPTNSLISSLGGDNLKLEDLLAELEQEKSAIRKSKLEDSGQKEESTSKKSVLCNYLSKASALSKGVIKVPLEQCEAVQRRNLGNKEIKSSTQTALPTVKDPTLENKVKVNIGDVTHRQRSNPRTSIEAYRTIIKPKLLGETTGMQRTKVQIKQIFLSKDAFNKKLMRNGKNKKFIKI